VSVPVSASGRSTAAAKFVEQCRQTFGFDAAAGGDATAQFTIDGQRPAAVCRPASTHQLSRCVAAAAASNLAIVPVGNGAQLGIGSSPRRYDVAMCTRRMARVVSHEAADMTVTVEAGATLDELNVALGSAAQFLPIDPPRSRDVTIGGLIATDATGPLRLGYGKVRDLLIGIRAVLADGTVVKGGGRVVKNVAGYDLMKLLAGSHGSLAIVAEATFKIRPRPEAEGVFLVGVRHIEAAVAAGLQVLNAPVQPAFVEALNENAASAAELPGAALIIGCHGSNEEIEAQHGAIESVLGAGRVVKLGATDGADLMARVRELSTAPGSAGAQIVTPVSRLASTLGQIIHEARERSVDVSLMVHVGNGVALLRCPMARDKVTAFADFALWLRGEVAAVGGAATFDALPASLKDRIDPWSTDRALSAAQLSLMRSVKEALDPRGMLSPGCFVGGV